MSKRNTLWFYRAVALIGIFLLISDHLQAEPKKQSPDTVKEIRVETRFFGLKGEDLVELGYVNKAPTGEFPLNMSLTKNQLQELELYLNHNYPKEVPIPMALTVLSGNQAKVEIGGGQDRQDPSSPYLGNRLIATPVIIEN
ncbi:MAG: hypothetical protein AAF571_15665, partial [Verrucomicrobiota bacterium]